MLNATYKIYNASAGSGKTYTLTKEYLKIILSSKSRKNYRHILAITFTNKAVNEMKQRILGSLFEFSKTDTIKSASPMFIAITNELAINPEDLKKKATTILKEILHNYAYFDVSTIDKFTHRLIRTFAKDLKIPQNFEVVLDTDLLLSEAISKLIYKAGTDEKLTKVLLDFALEKIDEDKSWDISFDLNKIGKLLFNETNSQHLKKLDHKTIDDFIALKKNILSEIKNLTTKAIDIAHTVLTIIDTYNLDHADFTRGTLPNHFKKIIAGELNNSLYANKLEENLASANILKKSASDNAEAISHEILPLYNTIKKIVYQILFLKNSYKNIVPLTLLNAIQQEIKNLELEQDLLPISSFNAIISNEIKNQPTPFIYERLGEKYQYFFIDEFQDTSEMQWNNLIPLVSNALEGEDLEENKGSLLLVGDTKQAIYRWRGGKAEQFLNLVNSNTNPFVAVPEIENLPANYRSHEEIIKFNNAFFSSTSDFLNHEKYNQLFLDGNKQETNHKKGGFVNINFIENNSDNTDEDYCSNILDTIKSVKANNFKLSDICILTRKKKHGILLANFLMHNNIPIISSETLLLKNNPKISFLINLLQYNTNTENQEIKYNILLFLAPKERHNFISAHLNNLDLLLKVNYDFDTDILKKVSVFDGLEYAIKKFNLISKSDAYINYLMDTVLDVEQKEGAGSHTFLSYWEKQKETLSITAPENTEAIQIMTVHKSKGLEFPIVIFPYANTYIYEEIEPKLWIPVDETAFMGFNSFLLDKKQEVKNYDDISESIYNDEQNKLELDAFNILYVALTRAEKALYIITEKNITSKGEHKTEYYSGLFIHYLKQLNIWDTNKTNYSFGELPINIGEEKTTKVKHTIPYLYTYKESPSFKILTNSGAIWGTSKEEAINKGNTIHQLLSFIKTGEDVEQTIVTSVRNGTISKEESLNLKTKIYTIINHPELSEFYKTNAKILNERDIITEKGIVLRPDRVIIDNNNVTIIDYKTGQKNDAYKKQINSYALAFEKMGYVIKNKIIVYINEEISLVFIS